jgi:hypothetical protein
MRAVCEINACPMVRFYLISLRAIPIGIKTDRAVDPNFGLAVCKIRFNEKKKEGLDFSPSFITISVHLLYITVTEYPTVDILFFLLLLFL